MTGPTRAPWMLVFVLVALCEAVPTAATVVPAAASGDLAATPGVPTTTPGVPTAAAGADGWGWPLAPPPTVVHDFDAPVGPYAPGHRGVDLAAAVGQPVLAAGSGVVAFAGAVAGRGVLSVEHPGGLRTTYEPVRAVVRAGQAVERGDVLGQVTAAPGHCLPGTCLHWGLRRGTTYLDPLSLVDISGRVRLLPLWGSGLGASSANGQQPWPAHPARAQALHGPAPPLSASSSTATWPLPSTDRGPLLAGVALPR
jgi:murein DD-endopeptidase MepM/ murein hydrolase activator NlpD